MLPNYMVTNFQKLFGVIEMCTNNWCVYIVMIMNLVIPAFVFVQGGGQYLIGGASAARE